MEGCGPVRSVAKLGSVHMLPRCRKKAGPASRQGWCLQDPRLSLLPSMSGRRGEKTVMSSCEFSHFGTFTICFWMKSGVGGDGVGLIWSELGAVGRTVEQHMVWTFTH